MCYTDKRNEKLMEGDGVKKLLCVFVLVAIILSCIHITSFAEGNQVVMLVGNQHMLVNGEVKSISSTSPVLYPYISNSRVLVPLRAVSEAFGAEVAWDGETKTATIKYNGNEAKIVKDSRVITVNGEEIEIDTDSVIVYGSFFLPLRVVAENILGKHIEYVVDGDNRVIVITDDTHTSDELKAIAHDGANKLNGAVDSSRNGITEDGKYYYINGRAYPVMKHATKQGGVCTAEGCPLCGQDVDIPIISFNYKLTEDYIIKAMIESDMKSLMEPVDINGQELYVRREVAAEFKLIMDEIIASGYEINSIHTFRIAEMDFVSDLMAKARGSEAGSLNTAFHPNGLAVDINSEVNPLVYTGSDEYSAEREKRYSLTDPIDPVIHFNGHIVTETFKKHGWEWGLWSTSSDYMHFSMGEY